MLLHCVKPFMYGYIHSVESFRYRTMLSASSPLAHVRRVSTIHVLVPQFHCR